MHQKRRPLQRRDVLIWWVLWSRIFCLEEFFSLYNSISLPNINQPSLGRRYLSVFDFIPSYKPRRFPKWHLVDRSRHYLSLIFTMSSLTDICVGTSLLRNIFTTKLPKIQLESSCWLTKPYWPARWPRAIAKSHMKKQFSVFWFIQIPKPNLRKKTFIKNSFMIYTQIKN